MRRLSGYLAAFLLATASLVGVQVITAGSASATTCTWIGSGTGRYEYCSGIRHEVIAAKFVEGTNQWYINQDNMYFNGKVVDKAADGECTWMRIKVTNAYWPASNPNIYTQPDWKVCGAGNSKIVGIYLDQAWMYPGKVEFQHCAMTGGQMACPTIFSRNV